MTIIQKGEKMNKDMIYRQEAIDALDCVNGTEEVLRSLPSAQPELCEDAVSRAKINAFCHIIIKRDPDGDNDIVKAFEAFRAYVNSLPSVTPKPRTGKWIDEGFYADGHGAHAFRCSECGGHIIEYDTDPFCKWCGADMRTKETDCDYERAVDQLEHDILYEPTFNQDDGSM